VLINASVLNKTSIELRDHMASKGIYIRPMSGGHGMSEGFIRITIGTPDQNELFIQTFKAYAEEVIGLEF
jgi:histidinol-phosphate/aromatic aminotransferase/cobyric acid decarboxylase-like protein